MPKLKRKCTTPASELRIKLKEIRADIRVAQAIGTMTAACSLHRLEVDVLALLWEREGIEAEERAAAEAASKGAQTEEEVIADIIAAASALPAHQRQTIAAALTGRPKLRAVSG
jgi:hypothetical protein